MSDHADPTRLAELIAARMSHDVSGLIGTLAAALEMATEETSAASEALSVAADAADGLVSRLRLLRAAWGPSGDSLNLPGLRALAKGLPGAGRVSIALAALPDDTAFTPDVARMVLNLLLLAKESLPAGGEVALAGTATDLVVSIAGPGAAWPKGLPDCLCSEANAWAAVQHAHTLQAPLTALLARSLGLRLSLLPGDPLPKLLLNEI